MPSKNSGQTILPIPGKGVSFGKLIKESRSKAGITQSEFAEMMKVTRNTIINWEADKSKPDHEAIPEICALLGVRVSEPYGMESETDLTEVEERIVSNFRLLSPASRKVVDKMIYTMLNEELMEKDKAMKETFGLFLVRPGRVAAGAGDCVPDSPPTYTFLRKNTINERADGIVKVRGDSMEPVYHSGDYVYYENAVAAFPGEDVIVDTDDGAVIKRLGADRTLYSVNPDIPYPKKNDQNSLVIRGRVLGTVHSSDRPAKREADGLEDLFVDEIREFNRKYGLNNGD